MSVHCDLQSGVARVTIDRPDVLNALDSEAEQQLLAVWDQLEIDQ